MTSAISNDDPNHTSVYLRALLARWDDWFGAARTGEVSAEITPLQIPFADASSPTAERSNSGTVSDEAWRRWLTEIPGVQTLLPSLAAQQRSMAEMNTHFEARLHTAKMDSLKEFAYGAGHELNNPLANIASRAQTLLARRNEPRTTAASGGHQHAGISRHEMLADLMLFARPPQLKPEPVDLVQLVDDVLRELEAESAASEIVLHHPTRRDPLVIEADPVQLHVALRTLCVNSMEAIGKQGNVTIELCVSDADPRGRHSGDVVQMVVSDDGPGIAPELHSRIFDPFYSGREAGRGLGFGLSKCWRIVTLHGGWIDVQ